jgi:NAD(P)-dependent dehydrogenase (short-subunit alcohol dehydrogenase family)
MRGGVGGEKNIERGMGSKKLGKERISLPVNKINLDEEKLDILINNAGIMFYPSYEKTIDGHEITWQSNYLGLFIYLGTCVL